MRADQRDTQPPYEKGCGINECSFEACMKLSACTSIGWSLGAILPHRPERLRAVMASYGDMIYGQAANLGLLPC